MSKQGAEGTRPLRIALVAGEASGDLLGADLIAALREQHPGAEFFGITGPRMDAAGCEKWYSIERLSVMGLVEVLGHLRELLALRRELIRRLLDDPPDVYVGIDAPDFNLPVERTLKRAGIHTVHYVSPSVWAWRRYRVRKIRASVDRMLALFPFEADFYHEHEVPVDYIGHPLADRIPLDTDVRAARVALGIDPEARWIALLPGSRGSEVRLLARDFIDTAAWCHARAPDLQFVVPLANAKVRALFEKSLADSGQDLPLTLLDGQAREAMASAEAVLLASGTATLEAMLLQKPMVVAYRLAPLTHWLAQRLVKVPHFALPNLLTPDPLVREFLQDAVTPQALGEALLECIHEGTRHDTMRDAFAEVHRQLRRGASHNAARAILEVAQL